MGFLDFIFGGEKQESESQQAQTSTTQRTGTQEQVQDESQAGKRKVTTTGTTSSIENLIGKTLTDQDIAILAGLTEQLSAQQFDPFFGEAVRGLQIGAAGPLDVLTGKATGGLGVERDAISKALRDVAAQSFEREEGAQIAGAQQVIGAGAEFNTLSQLIGQRGEEELATRLAGIEASVASDFERREREAAVQALAGAESLAGGITGAGQLEFQNLIQALQVATGTQTEQQQIAEQEQVGVTEEEELITRISELLSTFDETTTSRGTGTGTGTTTVSGSLPKLLSGIGSLSGFFKPI